MTLEEKKEYHRTYYQNNKIKWQGLRKWALNNPEKNRESKAAWRARNREKHNSYNRLWSKRNKGKVTAYARAYQLLKLHRIPKWLSDKDRQLIMDFYENRPIGQHVDHIVPLKGKTVSGLHVPWNLQYLSAEENIKKSNLFK